MDPVLEANGTFALNLLKKLGEDSSKNVFFSPCSISSSLAMVLLGARGFTESQIAEVLGFNKCSSDGDGDVHQSLQLLLSEVNKTDKQYLLRTANRLFGDKAYKILSTFKDACRKFYQAEMEELDFTFTEECRRHINSWVARNTEDKITELLTPELLNEFTVLVLVNAIYFKGKWEKPFSKDETQERPFKVSKDVVKPVPMMHKRGTFNATYIGEIFTKILMLPYVGKELNMIILLPDEHVDLQTVEKKLTYKKLVEWTRLDMMDEEEVEVYLPRFRMEENYNMKEVLQSLGMKDAFDSVRADFSGMSSSGGLVLSEVVHKSFVEVSEEGTEAVAATAAIMMLRCARFSLAFNANRPFLFFIQHSKSKAIMFCGRFASP